MFKHLFLVSAVALAPLFATQAVQAQAYTTVSPPTAVGYIPVRRGLFGLRSEMQPVVVPGSSTTVVNRPVVTTNYTPTTTYYTPTTSYYTPTTSYHTPEVTTTNYTAPATTTYYAPSMQTVPATSYPTQTSVNYYPKTYWYSTPAPVPRSVGMPIIGY